MTMVRIFMGRSARTLRMQASDPDRRLYRKAAGREAKLSDTGSAVMENRHGLAVAGMVTHANGTAERRASEIMFKASEFLGGPIF